MIRLLASVRDVAEAVAAVGGADFIDLKEPRAGALGGLPHARVREVVAALRHIRPDVPISATIGDHPAEELARIDALVAAVGNCGVDYVKVGVAGGNAQAQHALLERLAAAAPAVVPVFIADRGLDFDVVEQACRLPFPALMADTEDKRAGSLFDCVAVADLARFVALAHRAGKLVGLSGALREEHLPDLAALVPDFAGFRGALCEGTREAKLAPGRLARLRDALRAATPIGGREPMLIEPS
ncbi:(5-formylfuran-3-yl)methyl phosphate synthase [Aromatoleum sp.]|uniref:(5-formylfuran-3-yl)methyl phosphate synthase n=1 Tax=Aromatoleum sp. TaxID=2307007 RepID=UPI002FCB8AA2